MTTRKQLEKALVELDAVTLADPQAELDARLMHAARQMFPRVKKWTTPIVYKRLGPLIVNAFADQVRAAKEAGEKKAKETADLIAMAYAEGMRPFPGDLRVELTWLYGGTYSNQTRPEAYLRGKVELEKEELEEACAGLGDFQLTIEESAAGGLTLVGFVGSRLDARLLTVHHLQRWWTVEEWVRRCWGKGLNPRVFHPYLEHGFEEKHGLDYFGNKVTG